MSTVATSSDATGDVAEVKVGTPADKALLLIRIAAALTFLYHGSQILFGAFGGPGPAGFAAFMKMPTIVGVLVGLAQFGGGLAMLTGVFARFGAACIVIVMLGAIVLVHLPHGFSEQNKGVEFPLVQLIVALAVLLDGPGKYTLARFLPPAMRKL